MKESGKRKKNRAVGRRDSGYTLIELIAVLAILAVLTAVAIPCIKKYTEGAYRASAGTEAQIAADAVQRYLDDQMEKGELKAGKIHKLMDMELNDPNCVLKEYISGGQKEARIVSVDVNLKEGRLTGMVYENEHAKVRLTIRQDGTRALEYQQE